MSVVVAVEGSWFPASSQFHQRQPLPSVSSLQCFFMLSLDISLTLLKSSHFSVTWVMVWNLSCSDIKAQSTTQMKNVTSSFLKASLGGSSTASYAHCLFVPLILFSLSSSFMSRASQRPHQTQIVCIWSGYCRWAWQQCQCKIMQGNFYMNESTGEC